jgi:hypothetical protein
MNRFLILFSLAALVILGSCKKDETTESTPDNQAIVAELFTAGMAWHTQPVLKSSVPINIQVDQYVNGPEGGNIHLIGSVTGSMTIDDNNGSILGGTMLIGITETINDYAMKFGDKVYTMNGAPYVSLAGTFTLLPGGSTFGTASSMQIGGGYRITGDGYDKTVNIQVTILINKNGTGGTVSGTIDVKAVNYSF